MKPDRGSRPVLVLIAALAALALLLAARGRGGNHRGAVDKTVVTANARVKGEPVRRRTTSRIEGIDVQGWHARAVRNRRTINRLRRQLRQLRRQNARHLSSAGSSVSYWIDRQVAAAETIARESANDPWPSCPDPHDGSGASWWSTVQCENGGDWLDTPGYYRCGLQFDPMWERRFGRLCP